jgi:endonuclease V-like protein UPF0215 family
MLLYLSFYFMEQSANKKLMKEHTKKVNILSSVWENLKIKGKYYKAYLKIDSIKNEEKKIVILS